MKFLVAEKWELEIASDCRNNDVSIVFQELPYTWFVEHKTHEVSKEIWCYEKLLTGMSGVDSVIEYFGGVGCDAVLIDGILKPKRHILLDIDEWLVEHLANQFPKAEVYNGDFFQVSGFEKSDLACMDFNSFTMTKLMRNFDLREALGKALEACKFAILTDTVIFHVWFHTKVYSKLSGRMVTNIDDYLIALSHCLYELYGFSIVEVASHSGASYILLHKGDVQKFNHFRTPESAKISHFRKIS